ncbi:PREDICTED: uncharacterized protein LOC108782971 [Cyphomyrmex costatus]|uniref:uncharacterized protein LOC108782971 n=1 Tax=Cyphomyrmex costatus TaxID=456900 RepID=UPI00085245EA|nr:PREDICTED: uncharacterized protein LOC108782971 [Cyphomyrmex costatus]
MLQQLKEPIDKWDTLIIYLVASKLDATTKGKWDLKVIQDKAATIDQLFQFLTSRCEYLEARYPTHSKTSTKIPTQKATHVSSNKKGQTTTLTHVATSEADVCGLCKQAHKIYSCKVFKELSVESRRNEAKRLNLCYNCLGSNHILQKCTSRTCKHCSKKHHTLLHINEQSNSANQISGNGDKASVNNNEVNTITLTNITPTETSVSLQASNFNKVNSEVLLSTAIIYIRDSLGKYHRVRALLDNGSQASFITKSMCQRLGLKTESTKHSFSCLNVAEALVAETTQTTIASITTTYETDVQLFVVNQVTRPIPTRQIKLNSISLPRNLELADPTFHIPQNIDVLLGATIFWEILETERIQLGSKQPTLQSTKLGWLLCGRMGTSSKSQLHNNVITCGHVRNEELQERIERFWRIEDIPKANLLSTQESQCEEMFQREYRRTDEGRFEVSLPFRADPNTLGESKSMAFKRLCSMERKFRKDSELQARYIEFMDEYARLGHMSILPDDEERRVNYLPHHAVIKEAAISTKLRVVFDASSPTTSGKSLNDCLLVGPTIQPELFELLIRFRQHPYVLTGDIIKMYRQVMVKPEHRLHQCILWRDNPNKSVETFTLNTVTYGVASAPYLAIRCLQQLSLDFEKTHPHSAAIISRDFYVDDLITGEESVQLLLETKIQISEILKTAGFELAKIRSNTSLCHNEYADNQELTDTKVLGLLWHSTADTLRYEATCDSVPAVITKRYILSIITQIFDPLGLIGPVIIKAKILLQSLWQLKIEWDTPIPETIRFIWSSYYQQLPLINRIVIPRHAVIHNPVDIQLHGFCDASQSAYGACIFIRSVDEAGAIKVQLLTAKSRVAPLKTVSVPRLELCGAVLLAELVQKVAQSLTCAITEHHFWTDSEIVLAWIKGELSQWQTFVANRIAEIQRLTNKQYWSHVRSEHNPADLISRGVLPNQLINATLWWEGPHWLKITPSLWPVSTAQLLTDVPESRNLSVALFCTVKSIDFASRYSSCTRLKRVIATCIRFKTNCALSISKSPKLNGPLTSEELQRAMIILIKIHQQGEFSDELRNLQRNQPIDSHSKIISLNPVIDQDGLLRVGGRLRNAPLSYAQKHPILLSSHDTLTDLIIRDQHLNHFHMGPQLLLTTLRETYWIIHAKSAIKRVLRTCLLCFRLRPRSMTQRMGDLPESRVTPSRAFCHAGVDYAGPFNIKISRNKSGKAYLCLFVCMATKAIHLELVSDLSTEGFLNALKRFISRRGKCDSILSDNGRNFVGASNILRQLGQFLSHSDHQATIVNYASDLGISWKFIPPHSPHMGGLWEANVKAVKTHLKTVINDTPLSFEEFYTVLTQIEAILNSRPLCPLSNSPDELEVLTPGHFLIGTSLMALPEKSVLDIPQNRINRYQLLMHLQQSFWKRWSKEYVTQLQQRTKWKTVVRNDELQIGKLAIIRDETSPPLKWRIGRICELHPGADSLTRVVSLKTTTGIIQRPLTRICILPID